MNRNKLLSTHFMGRHPKQFFFKGLEKPKPTFGGSLLKGHAKKKRPIDSKLPIHLVLRATRSVLRKPNVFGEINKIVYHSAKRHGVKVYEFANVGNHLHLLIKVEKAQRWAAFIRELTGRIAFFVRKNVALSSGLWLHRPFTRLLQSWRREFRAVKEYVLLNSLEGEGFIDRRQTRSTQDLERLLVW